MANMNMNNNAEPDSSDSCFSQLRRLARHVDSGVNEVKTRIEEMEMNGGVGSDVDPRHSDETAALLFLQRSQKDIREISSDVKTIHNDFKMRSATLNSVSQLFGCALESFRKRLDNVECFTEQYGYKRPVTVVSMPDPTSPSSAANGSEEPNSETSEVDSADSDGDSHAELQETGNTDLVKENENNLSDPGTPKLEDIGLSGNTMFKLNSGYFDNMNHGSCTPPRSVHENVDERYSVAEHAAKSQKTFEISTPKLEDYGISEHTLKYLKKDVKDEVKVNKPQQKCLESPHTPIFSGISSHNHDFHKSNISNTMKQEKETSNEMCSDFPPTPKLDGLSEHTLMFLNNTEVEKENVCLDSTPVASPMTSYFRQQSPEFDRVVGPSHESPNSGLPATPKFDLTGLSQHTLRFLNSKEDSLF